MTPLLSIIVCVYNQPHLVVRALDSIPRRNDIEVVVVDDGSTDETLDVLTDYAEKHDLDMRIITYDENRGLGHAKNVAFDACLGEYIHELDSDDCLYTEVYEQAMSELTGEDIVYINLVPNDGFVMRLTEDTKHGYCAGIARFYKRSLLGSSRCPEIRAGEDWYLNEELLAKPHTEKFTDLNAYHYNFPREGSLFDLLKKGLI